MVADHVGATIDDHCSKLDAALVIVGQIENKEIVEIERFHLVLPN
jgi:hypothetical protein